MHVVDIVFTRKKSRLPEIFVRVKLKRKDLYGDTHIFV